MTLPSNQAAGTAGGTLTAIIAMVDLQDVVTTIILATIGAVVSFCVSALLRRWFGEKG